MIKRAIAAARIFKNIVANPRVTYGLLKTVPYHMAARRFAPGWRSNSKHRSGCNGTLGQWFDSRTDGRGVWKWRHYLDLYERHFAKFVGSDVHILEVGIYSGGSLEMWRDYFGPQATIYGVDIMPACKKFEQPGTRIFIGDQSDRDFWRRFRDEAPRIDIVIDDGSHLADHQRITLEEMFPHLSPGGVYLCEDVRRTFNVFANYTHALADQLNHYDETPRSDSLYVSRTAGVQRAIHSIHFYPFVVVIEKHDQDKAELISEKRGAEWLYEL